MKIKDRIEFKNKPATMTFKSDDMVITAVKAMSEKNYGAGVIIDNDSRPIGIITERDFMRRVLANDLNPNTTRISEIMTKELKLANHDDEVVEWLRLMSNERFRHLPVVDENGKLLALMSQGDFVSYTWPHLLLQIKDNTVKSFMERFHLHLLIGSIMVYSIAMVFFMRYATN